MPQPLRLRSSRKHDAAGTLLVFAHDPIVALETDETSLLAIMGAAMGMIPNAGGEGICGPDRRGVDEAVEIHPFAAVVGPGLPTKRLADSATDDGLLDLVEVFASHMLTIRHARKSFGMQLSRVSNGSRRYMLGYQRTDYRNKIAWDFYQGLARVL
jgi:hypothetical protein